MHGPGRSIRMSWSVWSRAPGLCVLSPGCLVRPFTPQGSCYHGYGRLPGACLSPGGFRSPCGEAQGSPGMRHLAFARGGLDLPPGFLMKYHASVSVATPPAPKALYPGSLRPLPCAGALAFPFAFRVRCIAARWDLSSRSQVMPGYRKRAALRRLQTASIKVPLMVMKRGSLISYSHTEWTLTLKQI
jgi:hypothetical protein